MLPPVLEIYVVWHPGDVCGQGICEEIVGHFHGTVFSGLIGGAVEVYARSAGWVAENDAPRPISFDKDSAESSTAQFFAIVPILGNELAAAVQSGTGPWCTYLQALVDEQTAEPHRVGVFPYRLDAGATVGTVLQESFAARYQCIAASPVRDGDTPKALRCRDLTQGIAQLLARRAGERLTVFISHTKRDTPGEAENVGALIATVRRIIGETRLGDFFDANDLQPGRDWDADLRTRASTSALLALRTDLYPSREWCQREVLIAKRSGMPVIIVDALGEAEERGSFLMDHVPRVPARMEGRRWRESDIYRALNILVDECLKRFLWERQRDLAEREGPLNVAWWAPHAPEPITLAKWMDDERRAGRLPREGDLIVLHPDPPLGPEEKNVLQELISLAGMQGSLDAMTPRLLAARGGHGR